MSDRWSDDERVAAFLDGRMDDPEHEEMVAHLSRNGEDRDVLAATAFILAQLEGAEDEPAEDEEAIPVEVGSAAEAAPETAEPEGVIRLDSRRAAKAEPSRGSGGTLLRLAGWGAAIAAVLAGVALVTVKTQQGGGLSGEPVRLARQVPEGFPGGWLESRPWGTRGSGGTADTVFAAERSAQAAQAAQAGMMLVDLAVAVEARDSAETRLLAREIGERFDALNWERGALGEIATNAGAGPGRLRPRIHEATARLAARMDSASLRLGAWTEAAGLAAAGRDAGFFRESETREVLDRAEQVTAANPPAKAALRDVRRLLGTDPPAWDDLVPALRLLARELATE